MEKCLNHIYFNSVDEIFEKHKKLEISKAGSRSNIFKLSDSRIMKIFNSPPTEEHLKILNYFSSI